eukprot:502277-Rhodomonas_salina.1
MLSRCVVGAGGGSKEEVQERRRPVQGTTALLYAPMRWILLPYRMLLCRGYYYPTICSYAVLRRSSSDDDLSRYSCAKSNTRNRIPGQFVLKMRFLVFDLVKDCSRSLHTEYGPLHSLALCGTEIACAATPLGVAPLGGIKEAVDKEMESGGRKPRTLKKNKKQVRP